MTENGTPEVEYAYVVVKQEDGRISIANTDSIKARRQPTIDDIFSSIKIVERDIVSQQSVAALISVLNQSQGGQSQTQSGLVVPKPNQKFEKVVRGK